MRKRSQRKHNANDMNGAKLQLSSCENPKILAGSEEGQSATFSMLLYAGGPIRPGGWRKPHPIVVDLKGMTVINAGSIPFNRGHKGDTALVGHGTAEIEATSIRINDGVFSFDNEHSQQIIASSKAGFQWASSMEVSLMSTPRFIAAGKSVHVNGKTINGPIYVAPQYRTFRRCVHRLKPR